MKKSRKGEIKQFTGIDQPYEEPQHPEVIINYPVMSLCYVPRRAVL
jgi:adenylylsulfate kinase